MFVLAGSRPSVEDSPNWAATLTDESVVDVPIHTSLEDVLLGLWRLKMVMDGDNVDKDWKQHTAACVRVVKPAYYLEFQRISGGGCGGNLSIKGGAKVLKKVYKSGCVATITLISYVEKRVFYLLRKMTRNCIKENITV